MGEVAADDWDRLSERGGLYASHRFVAAIEETEPAPGAPLEVYLCRDQDRVVGALPVWRGLPSDGGRYDPAAMLEPADQPQAAAGWDPFDCLGARTGYSNALRVDPDMPRERRVAVSNALLGAVLEDGKGRACVFPYLDGEGAADAVRAMPGAKAVLTGADTVLDVPEGGFEDYLGLLSSKRRTEVRREVAGFVKSGIQVELTTLAEASSQVVELLARRVTKYGGQADTDELAEILARYGRAFGSDALVLLARDGGRPVAYVSLYRWRSALYARSWGALETDAQAAVYFNLVYYEPVRLAASLGIRRLHFGMLAYAAKVRRGARLDPRWSVLCSPEAEVDRFEAMVASRNASAAAQLRAIDTRLSIVPPYGADGLDRTGA